MQSPLENPAPDGTDSTQSGESTRLKIVFVGHVDHGKSTLIGRIFHDTHSLPEGKIESIRAACKAEGMEFEYAFLLDALLEEQEQNITIDTTQIQFRTGTRNYVIIDAPGHKEFLKNMITGAASADAAVLLIAANEGVCEQSRRHGYLLSLLGVRQVIVAVNKMDLAGYDRQAYEDLKSEYSEFLARLGLEASFFIPISARNGVNVVQPDSKEMPWYQGLTLVQALDRFQMPPLPTEQPLRFPIQDVYRFDQRRILSGRIESGTLRVGDKLVFSPNNKTTEVASIERWNAPACDYARAGESVGITLTEQIFVQRGHVASHLTDTPIETNRIKANLFWMGRKNLEIGPRYKLKLATQEIDCTVLSVDRIIDASTLETVSDTRNFMIRNDVAEVTLQTRTPLVLDNYDRLPVMGRFVIMDDRHVAGGGVAFDGIYTDRVHVKSENISWSEGAITPARRALRNGHKGAVLWLTGFSGAGKSTIAYALDRELFKQGFHCFVLDGDNIRHGLNANLGFSHEDRVENIRRVAEVARLMGESGLICISAFISPYRADRCRAREIALEGGIDFIEAFIDAPLSVCEQRDPKSLYKKARAGQIQGFTGIDAPYEQPVNPEVTVHTDRQTLDESVTTIMDALLPKIRTGVNG